ncbi:aminotransferase class V-fold PLP-dependent enzyme [Trueperella sp. LYQ143]|uniref:aminotransferase class V-fold PLP-dependent enzyme n=1 Tax=unclassified Trueperella TaxID=2630174 RepID=UPI0039836AD6
MFSPAPRADFPILDMTMQSGERLVYLDSGATSQMPQYVIDVMNEHIAQANGAVKRGAHELAGKATLAFEQARQRVADFVGARPDEILWTKNSTEALNSVAYILDNLSRGRGQSVVRGGRSRREKITAAQDCRRIGQGDNIVVTRAEHHANLLPWQELCYRTGAELRWFDLDAAGRVVVRPGVIDEHTKVVAMTHISNVTGAVSPVAQLVALAREVGALTVLDACQSVPHIPVNFAELGVDFAAFSGHKMLGPTGIGALYGRRELLEILPPFLVGGSMVQLVTMERTTYADVPARFEAGTQPVVQAVAMGAAAEYLGRIGMDTIAAHEVHLTQRALAAMENIPGVRILGPTDSSERVGVISFVVDAVHPHDVSQLLDARGIAIRVGHHCAQPIHQHFGVTASCRLSFGPYNNEADVDRFISALETVRPFFIREGGIS